MNFVRHLLPRCELCSTCRSRCPRRCNCFASIKVVGAQTELCSLRGMCECLSHLTKNYNKLPHTHTCLSWVEAKIIIIFWSFFLWIVYVVVDTHCRAFLCCFQFVWRRRYYIVFSFLYTFSLFILFAVININSNKTKKTNSRIRLWVLRMRARLRWWFLQRIDSSFMLCHNFAARNTSRDREWRLGVRVSEAV